MIMKKNITFLFLLLLVLASCSKTPDIDNATMLDGDQIYDPSIANPKKYLISDSIVSPSDIQKNTPVIIAAHGYSATTFEWDELRAYADSAKTFYVSQVLLGGHGLTYADFKKATWEDWQSSIITEYRKLDSLGFKKIFLAGSSTGAPLIINMVKSGFFATQSTQPKGIFLVDPIIVSSDKALTMVGLLGPILGFTTVELSNGEKGHWYVYRPQQTLKQLMALINITRIDLQNGIRLPTGTYMKVYKSKTDATADPISALMIYKGMQTSVNGNIDVEMIDSKLHVFTRLEGRADVTAADSATQKRVFKEMELKMKN
jgi:carboxylesterase